MRRGGWVAASGAAVAFAGLVWLHMLASPARGDEANEPHYTDTGNLVRPENFHGWIFVGSNLGLGYNTELAANTPRERSRLGEYHNIYLAPEAYAAYAQTRTFPDKTVLVMDVYGARTKEPRGIVDKGSFNGPSFGIEVAVKNKMRPDGKTTDWAYYDFTDRSGNGRFPSNVKAQDDSQCYACHKAHAGVDNVWVQFYPVLRDMKNP
ncbi:MAG TPA: cytochrome P460 family protein [Xanthobacteraceae bacterium]|nr:cytochrome P460 family protein [Xanthobacteraceae bacterium]